MKCPGIQVLFLIAVGVLLGCGERPTATIRSGPSSAPSPAQQEPTEGVVKIVLLTDGTVLVNEEAVPVAALAAKLDSLGEVKMFWYHREDPQSSAPHPNSVQVITEIANRKRPVALYLDRQFTKQAD